MATLHDGTAVCGTCVCFCEDSRGSEFGTCISRRYPYYGRKPTKRATDAACVSYSLWVRKEQQAGRGDAAS